jgi:hypothetical protein
MQNSDASGSRPIDGGKSYSRAFERLVQSDDDLLGLLSYALYRQAIREAALHGRTPQSLDHRDLTPTEITVYRTMAHGRPTTLANSFIEQATPEIAETALRAEIGRLQDSLTQTIERATSRRVAIGTNLVAWLLSIAITFLIAVAGLPSWILALITKIKGG